MMSLLFSVEATKHKVEDMEDDIKTLKRRHANSIKVAIAICSTEFLPVLIGTGHTSTPVDCKI